MRQWNEGDGSSHKRNAVRAIRGVPTNQTGRMGGHGTADGLEKVRRDEADDIKKEIRGMGQAEYS